MNWSDSQARLNRYVFHAAASGAVFTIHSWGMNQQHYSNPLHKHSFFEICYVLDGQGTYLDDGQEYPLRKGTLFCSRPGITHQILSDTGMELVFVGFELDEKASSDIHREAFHALAKTSMVCIYDGDDLPAALLWRSLFLLQNHDGALPSAALSAAGAALLLSFPPLFGALQEPRRDSSHPNPAHMLKQAKLYITDNLGDNELSLGKVASYLNVSERHLSRLFASGIHESFTNYVRRVRVRAAAQLLRETDMPIQAVADMTGFGSIHYFSRTFRALMSETPAKFRANTIHGTTFI